MAGLLHRIYSSLHWRATNHLARTFLPNTGAHTRYEGIPDVTGADRITIGCSCVIGPRITLYTMPTGKISIGDNVFIGRDCVIASDVSVTIGDHVLIAEFVSIRDCDHRTDGTTLISQQGLLSSPVVISRGSWIGRGVAVLRGVTIGEGAVIGANSVVTRDIPAYAIAVGAPARVVRYRQGAVEPPHPVSS